MKLAAAFSSLVLSVLLVPTYPLAAESDQAVPAENTRIPARVIAIFDGDTIKVRLHGGVEEEVRYEGVDAPEESYEDEPAEFRAGEATEANRLLVGGKEVRLEFDIRTRDTYGRLLAYVFSGSVFVNEELVRQGHVYARTYQPNLKYESLLRTAEREAQVRERGVWQKGAEREGENPIGGEKDQTSVGKRHELQATGKKKHPYVASRKSDVFHKASCPHVKDIRRDNLITFASVQDARDSGRRPCKRCFTDH